MSRAVRGHILVDAALNTILLADAYNVPVPTKETAADTEVDIECSDPERDATEIQAMQQDTVTSDLTAARELYDRAISSTISSEEVCSAEVLGKIHSKLNDKKKTMTMRTALLWFQ